MSHGPAAGWRLLLTRPAEESAAVQAQLSAAGVFSSGLPLLTIEPLPQCAQQRATFTDLKRYCAVVVVSKPAARLGLARLAEYCLPPVAGQPWFSVGAGTAQILADAGLKVFYPPAGDDSEALLALPELAAALGVPAPRVLILRGEGGRETLAERLRGQGVVVDYLSLYRRSLPRYWPGVIEARVAAERLNGLVVSSGQGFEHLRQLATAAWPQLARLPLFVPSPRVAALARAAGALTVVDCRGASVAALLAALETRSPAAP
ncbi:MAG: uroporphyrinogen-III synthase [Pseudomonas sp.]|uniref:uroporphyrinogen-III synthase n=1 Tax=Pseudomonas sp. TaxID=306 RepID=UPI00339382BE